MSHYEEHVLNQSCTCCTICYMNKADAIAKNVMTKQANVGVNVIKMETIEGTKIEDDGEDGCYIDYNDLGKKNDYGLVTNSNIPLQENSQIWDTTNFVNISPEVSNEYSINGVKVKNKPIPSNELKDLYTKNNQVRRFDSGATRDQDLNKIDFEGFLSPIVLEEFGKYMLKHQKQANGELRPSDNWQKGMPRDVYMKSAWRHFHDWWMEHREYESREGMKDALNGLLFNVMGYMHELLKEENKNISKSEYKEELFY